MKIIGTGSAIPKLTVSNDMLAEFLETNDAWIRERTGIVTRHLISDEELEDLAADAARKAIENAGIDSKKIDYIICSNVGNQYITPSLSCIIQSKLGINCPCVDINAACSGFIYAMQMAEAMISQNMMETVLIVCAEEPSRFCNWEDRSTCILFGDAAGAVVVTKGDNLKAVRSSGVDKVDAIRYKKKLEKTPYLAKEDEEYPLYMKGQEVFRVAVSSSVRDIEAVLAQSGKSHDDVSWYMLHQANLRIIDAIRHFSKQNEEKFPFNVDRYGNTSSASIPLLLDEYNREGKLKKGDLIVFSAFGAGFTTAAAVYEW